MSFIPRYQGRGRHRVRPQPHFVIGDGTGGGPGGGMGRGPERAFHARVGGPSPAGGTTRPIRAVC